MTPQSNRSRISPLGLVAGSLLVCIALLTSCADGGSPTSPEQSAANLSGIADADFQPLGFLRTTDRPAPSARRLGAARLVKAKRGGRVTLEAELEDDDAELEIDIELKIRPRAMKQDTRISIGLEDPWQNVTLHLGESGTQFRKPAELTIALEGLDLSGHDADSIHLYLHDPETDSWYPVRRQHIEVDDDELEGTWLLDHFSRYSLSGGGGGNN